MIFWGVRPMKFKDRVAIITESGQGIGKEMTHRLAAEAASVDVSDNSSESGQASYLTVIQVQLAT
jgi:NAD(P)-dependent dehydrogenase (short-subunit alcohol dehydrogenase family)